MKLELNVERRDKNLNLNSLRKAGFLPAVIYGHNFKNIPLKVLVKDFQVIYKKGGESSLVLLKLDGSQYPVIIHEVQNQAVSNVPIHVDFYKVKMDEKINAPVKLVFTGESSAVKELGGILIKIMDEIEIKALPSDLPHELSADLKKLNNFGDSIYVRDINMPKGIEPQTNLDAVVATIQAPREEEKETEATSVPTPEEVEVIKKEKPTEETEEELPA